MASREILIYKAKLAEKVERYEDMIVLLTTLAKLDVELTTEERDLLSIGYKKFVGIRRASWRILTCMVQKEESQGNAMKIKEYRERVESEIEKICNDVIDMIDEHLVPSARTVESSVFYYKLKGDYNRYLAEFKTGDAKQEAAERSLKAYQMASSTANSDLPAAHPFRLGLALNFSVFYYEIMNTPERACELAQQAFEEAIVELDGVSAESHKDSTLIMQLLRDNLISWTGSGIGV